MLNISLFRILVLTSAGISIPAEVPSSLSLVGMVETYCVQPDGDHRLTWARASRDGFSIIGGSEFADLQAPGVHDDSLRGFTRTIDRTEYRVLTAASWLRRPDQGTTYSRWCWVSSSADDIDHVDRGLRSLLSNGGFRIDKVRMFAWIPRPDGTLQPVSRRAFMREGNQLAREQGMRQLISRRFEQGAFVGYASPRDEATYREFDWGGPEPVPAP